MTIDNRSGCKVNMALLNDQLSQLNQFYQDQCDLQSQLKNGDDEFKRLLIQNYLNQILSNKPILFPEFKKGKQLLIDISINTFIFFATNHFNP